MALDLIPVGEDDLIDCLWSEVEERRDHQWIQLDSNWIIDLFVPAWKWLFVRRETRHSVTHVVWSGRSKATNILFYLYKGEYVEGGSTARLPSSYCVADMDYYLIGFDIKIADRFVMFRTIS